MVGGHDSIRAFRDSGACAVPPKHIDSLEFARTRSSLQCELPVAEMSRLTDVLASREGNLNVELGGSRELDGKFWLHLVVTGELMLVCQRCLGGVGYPLNINSRLQLVKPGQAWPDENLEDDGVEPIEAEAEMDVAALVEDEVLLALPIVPKHKDCKSPGVVTGGEMVATAKPSPFAALATLKRH
jgi:uncharacterized protein